MRSLPSRTAAALLAGAVLLSGCGDDGGEAAPATDPSDGPVGEQPSTSSTVGTEEEQPSTGQVIEVRVSGGDVEGGGRKAVSLGETVTLRVSSDVADHVHLHGYDLLADVEAGGTAEITFDATIPGVFEVELEDAGIHLMELQIS